MSRFRMTLEYDGTAFVGWQRQDNGLSVQEVLEKAIYAFSGEETVVYGAGRTDAGVHALAQVAHFDLDTKITANKIREAMNAQVRPDPVAILEVEDADDNFHARFSAVDRSYQYRVLNRRAAATLDKGRVWHVPVTLDVDKMDEAAQVLAGEHDFSAFRAAVCQARTPVKSIEEISVRCVREEIHLYIRAKSFLHNQVRIIMGTLRQVGEGFMSVADVNNILVSGDRRKAGQTAPPHGLYLTRVRY